MRDGLSILSINTHCSIVPFTSWLSSTPLAILCRQLHDAMCVVNEQQPRSGEPGSGVGGQELPLHWLDTRVEARLLPETPGQECALLQEGVMIPTQCRDVRITCDRPRGAAEADPSVVSGWIIVIRHFFTGGGSRNTRLYNLIWQNLILWNDELIKHRRMPCTIRSSNATTAVGLDPEAILDELQQVITSGIVHLL